MGNYVEHKKSQPPKGRVFERVHTRKLDRSAAHNRMKKAGLKHVNKHDYTGYEWQRTRIGSYFSIHWREVTNTKLANDVM